MDDRENPPSFDELEARIQAARQREDVQAGRGPAARGNASGVGLGMRIGVELVAAVGIGVGIGLGLDSWLGTTPWLMVLFLILGGAAGVMNVYRVMRGMDETVGFEQARKRATSEEQARQERAGQNGSRD